MKKQATTAGVPRSISKFTRRGRKWFWSEGGFMRCDGRIEDQLRHYAKDDGPNSLVQAERAFQEALKTWPKDGGTT